ncbi:hemerythrin domain-containing protein (plasmid) [Leisingera sp. S132]|uniref:hemerythrin domain-containing protein n=1 Tax=Leisingera sp. S132 TaxID=2867016 RepID=UPI0021A2E107|nr:hemerythrin domain-containing protein [Leisingera sp. S132]UWQ81521.1 hemerythrin domain-containing protein [Leisingera sp. S132]
MHNYDYNAPDYHIASRGRIGPDLLQGLFPADRSAWDDDPRFLGWPAHLQRLHASISEASARLIGGLEVVLGEPEGSAQELMGLTGMNRLGLDLVSHVHGHHSFEDSNVLPGFLGRFPQLASAIDLLENDHQILDQALDQSEQVFALLRGGETSKSQIGKALEQAKVLNKILNRHTYDEEDILIPAVLHAYA